MRIIAGRFRRRKLLTSPGLTTRPITDRVKETLFVRLEDELSGARIVDVFAGTGTLGLEALSRGAERVVFIENDRRAHELLLKNAAALAVEHAVLCWRADVLRCSFRPKNVPDFLPYRVAFFDPPYRMVDQLQPGLPLFRALERLARPGVTAPEARLVLRTPERAAFDLPSAWQPERTLEVSSMTIHLCRRTAEGHPAGGGSVGP